MLAYGVSDRAKNLTIDDHLRRGYMAHPDSSENTFLNDLISAVDQRSYNG